NHRLLETPDVRRDIWRESVEAPDHIAGKLARTVVRCPAASLGMADRDTARRHLGFGDSEGAHLAPPPERHDRVRLEQQQRWHAGGVGNVVVRDPNLQVVGAVVVEGTEPTWFAGVAGRNTCHDGARRIGRGGMWTGRPCATNAASITASENVGWTWIVAAS